MLEVIEGDLFTTDAKYLVHQVNCITSRSKHLAYEVFKRYPYADVYSPRGDYRDDSYYKDEPGTILVRGNGDDQRYVIGLVGQVYPGKPRYTDSKLDGSVAREGYFFSALKKVAQIEDLESIAFPFGIGCGAAGGDWNIYFKILKNFAEFVDADVLIYRLKND